MNGVDIYTWLAVKAWAHLFSGKRVFNYKWYQYIYGSRLQRGYIALVEKCWLFMSLYISGLDVYMASGYMYMYITPIHSMCNSSPIILLSVAHMACYCNVATSCY